MLRVNPNNPKQAMDNAWMQAMLGEQERVDENAVMQQWHHGAMGIGERRGGSGRPALMGGQQVQQPFYFVPPSFNLNTALQGALGQMGGMNLANQQASMQLRGYDLARRNMDQMAAFRNRLLDTIGGMGSQFGSGSRLGGFQDTNSGQGFSLGGGGQTAITAQPMSPTGLQGTISAMRSPGLQARPPGLTPSAPQTPQGGGSGVYHSPGLQARPAGMQAPQEMAGAVLPRSPLPFAAGQQKSELENVMANNARAQAGQAALGLERQITPISAQLQQSIENARANLGLGNAAAAVGLVEDDARRNVAVLQPLIRALMGLV